MGEIKSVKVDNWGVFFLQKLQNFFNKTDYCDLTLQFFDNSQLKVHRLVLSACTDYFNVLEQTCEVIDDALIMPAELQADVVVPIVNFMYTGTLEFELKMYGKLLKTAKEMNMTVLLRLLEAHRRTMESVSRQQRTPSPKSVRGRRVPLVSTATATQYGNTQQVQQRRILTAANATLQQQQRRVVQTKNIATNASTSSASTTIPQHLQFRQQIGSTSLLKTSAGNSSQIKAQYGNITVYETTPQIKNEPEEYVPTTSKPQQQQNQATSPFEQLRKGYNNNKRPAVSTFISPPAKKPNIEDVKEFAEQQRMRKQIAAEYGDPDPCEYESMLDDDIHNYDDDDDGAGITTISTNSTAVQASTSRQQQQGSTTITFKQEQNDKPPTIVVKDSSNSNMNHAKIISEVLRQYPHLVKSNKNIKLKIMPNVGGQSQKIIVKKDQLDNMGTTEVGTSGQQQYQKPQVSSQIILKSSDKTLQQQQSQTSNTKLSTVQKPIASTVAAAATSTTATQAVGAATTSSGSGPQVQKRRIDSKTMHSLIALGAENTTGPWLCLRCGVNGRPISIPSYRGFRRHLINTHKETIDSALCEHCGWRSKSNRELHYHMFMEHKVKTTLYTFPDCLMCAEIFLDTNTLNQHMVNSHPEEKQQCIYCNKIFAREMQLYTHMKTYHKLQAVEDGIIDYSDEEFTTGHDEVQPQQRHQQQNVVKDKKDTKIKILSDISLPSASSLIKLEPSSEAAALSTVASGIATSIGITGATVEEFMDTSSENVTGEPKFVNVDGNEMLLTDEQRKEILSQLNQEHGSGGVVMVLNEPSEFPAEATNVNEGELHEATSAAEGDAETEAATASIVDKDNESGGGADGTSDFDDSQIYNEFTTTTQSDEGASVAAATAVAAAVAEAVEDEEICDVKKSTSSNLEESKESIDNLEWAENLISAHELADEVAADSTKTEVAEQQKAQKEDDISKKLKELTGDWSEDENDDEEHEEEQEEPEHESTAEEETETAVEATKEETNTEDEPEKKDVEAEDGVDATSDANLSTENVEEEEKAQKEQQQEENSDNEELLQSLSNAAAAAEVKVSKMDEDVIDDAMKNLHKERHIEDDNMQENKKETAETAKKPSADEIAEKMDVDDVDTDADDENANNKEKKLAEDEKAEEIGSSDEAKIKEGTNKSRTPSRDDQENISSIATIGEVDSKAILAELIADVDLKEEDQEFIAENPSAATTETDEPKEIAATGAEDAAAEAAVDQIQIDEEIGAIAAISTDSTDAIIKEEAADKKNTDIIPTTATTSLLSSSSKTEDKVKSLISEWGDDEDDDDDVGEGHDNKDDDDDL